MNKDNIKILFIAAIIAIIYGGYSIAKGLYVKVAWDQVDGVVVDFEKNTWSCGKGIGECYELVIGYHVDKNYFTINSKKTWNYNPPSHLLDKIIPVYYQAYKPADAIVGGGYGTLNYGVLALLFGSVMLLILWVLKKRGEI